MYSILRSNTGVAELDKISKEENIKYNKLLAEYDTMQEWEKEDYIGRLYYDLGTMTVSEVKFAQFIIKQEGKKYPHLRMFDPVI